MGQQAVDVLCTEVDIVEEDHFVCFEDKPIFNFISKTAAAAVHAAAIGARASPAAAAAAACGIAT